VLAIFLPTAMGEGADRDRLLFLAETLDGQLLTAQRPDEPFNPASVVKVGTSLWALERLGARHRYTTSFAYTGTLEKANRRIDGSLVIRGGGDPDFQVENAFLVAREFNRLGIHEVTGDLLISGSFWMGWENGAERRISDPQTRAVVMGKRLRAAFDPKQWDSTIKASWKGTCARRGWPEKPAPILNVRGQVRHRAAIEATPFLQHLSNPLAVLLKRFNTYSNNDLIRVADGLGGVRALEAFLRQRLEASEAELEISTASGEGRNRMTARVVVRLMRSFLASVRAAGLQADDLLPVPGCDPGPTMRMFPRLASGEYQHTVVCKTGTLTSTDGGVAVLSGSFTSRDRGTVIFCVAAPRTGRELTRWRRLEQDWLLDLIAANGGAESLRCMQELPYSDTFASVSKASRSGG
jgi:D-alanyl-D-alanine carboxypeptidase/D-alanyl-D-alanine-endopeptidase (penicillin-binding protein 4)